MDFPPEPRTGMEAELINRIISFQNDAADQWVDGDYVSAIQSQAYVTAHLFHLGRLRGENFLTHLD